MATTAEILALLTGRKVFDGHKWRVYDAGGTEIADPGGVLWRGVHGALYSFATAVVVSQGLTPGAQAAFGIGSPFASTSYQAPAKLRHAHVIGAVEVEASVSCDVSAISDAPLQRAGIGAVAVVLAGVGAEYRASAFTAYRADVGASYGVDGDWTALALAYVADSAVVAVDVGSTVSHAGILPAFVVDQQAELMRLVELGVL
jgi:hypothetical protein